MDEWEIPPLKSDGNKVHKRFCRLLIIMAFVGGALIEIGDNSTPGECEEGGALASIGGFLFWTSFWLVPINVLIYLVSMLMKEMNTGEVYLQAFFHIIMLIFVVAIVGEELSCHFPISISVAPDYNIGAGF